MLGSIAACIEVAGLCVRKKVEQAESLQAMNFKNEEGDTAEQTDNKRPVGRDAAKKRKSVTPSDSESRCLEVLQQMVTTRQVRHEVKADANEERNATQKEKLELLREQTALQREQATLHRDELKMKYLQNEQRIMNIDLNTMSGGMRRYYEKLQECILGRLDSDDSGPSAF